jgi:Potential Queuosine, Q, salvage protein family
VVITDEIRDACAWVADRAVNVRVADATIAAYAESLAASGALAEASPTEPVRTDAERETTVAFWLTLDAINFGSGWFPTLRKRTQPTGYRTIAAGVRHRFDEQGAWSASELAEIEASELAVVLDQEPDHELLQLFTDSLRDLGMRVRDGYAGCFTALVDEARGSAVALVARLAGWDSFADLSVYDGRDVPFLKRAQIVAADLSRAGAVQFTDMAALTLFADNLVPHVLRLDRVLEFEPALVSRIDRGELIEHGSPEEIEIRACAVQAVELIVAAAWRTEVAVTAARIDETLWNRGQGTDYKSVPRHRSRTTAY